MATITFDQIVYGPIHSRRLGLSLGVNLLPYDGKICSFDCIYCECGFNDDFRTNTKMPTRLNVYKALEKRLNELKAENTVCDVITFAGNGEPTLHPEFSDIIDDVIVLRNRLSPTTKISVLTNGLHVKKESVFNALRKIDNPILKLDSAFDNTAKLIDQPTSNYSIQNQIELYKKFNGNFILQSMFLKGEFNGHKIDNSVDGEVSAWLEIVKKLKPRCVMIYTIDRETPAKNLEKVPLSRLNEIAELVSKLGIATNVAG